jgi:acyl carrier protein
MSYKTVFELVRWTIAIELEMSEEEATRQILPATILEDLGVDSLNLVEIAMLIEESLKREDSIDLLVEDAERISCVQDIVDYLYDIGITDEMVKVAV